jgi:diguanylate cyclase (GGDEF)-like protein/PAS domain S-box-containing protein
MKDQSKTKQVLIQELDSLRERIAEMERTESERKQVEETLQLQEMQLLAILEATGDGILAVDNAGRVIRANRRFADLWKIPSGLLEKGGDEALLTYVLDQLVDPEAFLEKVHKLYESTTEDFNTILFKDGRIMERSSCALLNEGVINGRVWSFRDITDRVRAEEALKESEEKHRNLFQNANEAIFVAQDGKLVYLNPMSVNLIGYSGEEVMSRSFIEFIHPDDRGMVIDRHIRRMKGEEIPHLYSFRIIHRDGNVKWVELNTVSISWEGKPATLNFMSDITDRKQTEEAIRQMAYHDTLTGLPNRKLFFDRLGHDVGDLVLKEAAERLLDTMRRGDTVARFGGDEFILILPELKGADAVQVAEKLVDAFRKPFLIDDHELISTTSVGIAIYPGDGMDADALIKNADIAMYQAKQTGRDRYHLYKKS